MTQPLPAQVDVAIAGAGPHALTLVTHLLQKKGTLARRLRVFDPSGTWLAQWQRQFAALEIPHLRSPAVHHPDPDPYALRRFAEGQPTALRPPYDLPSTALFQDFCQQVVQRWQVASLVYPAAVTQLRAVSQGRSRFALTLSTGETVRARRMVLATGSHTPNWPDWVAQIPPGYPPERLCHANQVDLRQLVLAGERIIIVGGGLTSGHLAVGAIARRASVVLLHRRQFYEKFFDADPGWLGPKYLKAFAAEPDWTQRAQQVQQARNGGSLTPPMLTQLRRASHAGHLQFLEQCQIVAARWQGQYWQIHCADGSTLRGDRLWLATGTQLAAATQPLLRDLQATHPTPLVQGLPILDPYLRWPGCELYVMGGLAALQVGPTARNLAGARMAATRIVPALTKPRPTWNLPQLWAGQVRAAIR